MGKFALATVQIALVALCNFPVAVQFFYKIALSSMQLHIKRASRQEREQADRKESKQTGKRASRHEREQADWKESKQTGKRASRQEREQADRKENKQGDQERDGLVGFSNFECSCVSALQNRRRSG